MADTTDRIDELQPFFIRLSYAMERPLHSHDVNELYFACEDGGYQQWVDGARPMSVGNLFFFPSGMPHNGSGPETGTCRAIVVYFSSDVFSTSTTGDTDMRQAITAMGEAAKAGNTVMPTASPPDSIQSILEEMVEEMQHKRFGYVSCMKSLLMALLCDILRSGKLDLHRNASKPVTNEERILEVCRFLERNHDLPSSVGEMAAMANMSKSYFHAQFKAVTGLPYKEFLNELRSKTALNLLKTTDLPLEQVATRSGFGSVSNFYLVFRKQVGSPPRAIRRASDRLGSRLAVDAADPVGGRFIVERVEHDRPDRQ